MKLADGKGARNFWYILASNQDTILNHNEGRGKTVKKV